MNKTFLSPAISKEDTTTSIENIELLRSYIIGNDHSLVFFVGAGASMAGNTGMPSTPSLLYHLLAQALTSSGKFVLPGSVLQTTIKDISSRIGFEITLNDFWQICRQATSLLYESFAGVETKCVPNRVHAFLAHWLAIDGTVITTNYDRLIERSGKQNGKTIQSRYRDTKSNSFEQWGQDLKNGGTLFKIHGSLDDPDSCLGALEHVGTRLSGNRAGLLAEIIHTRPLCFVGWQGIDPDIPALMQEELEKRDPTLPIFWIHYEGNPSGSVSLQNAMEHCAEQIKPYAENKPILTEADRAFGEMLNWVGIPAKANPARVCEAFDFSKAVHQCTKTGLTRMVGITLRCAGRLDEAGPVLETALALAKTSGERSAAFQEISLLQQQRTGKDTGEARKSLEQARKALEKEPDLRLQLNADFGTLSMSIISLQKSPWLILKIPGLFTRYKRDIETLRKKTGDRESVALHTALFYLYSGRLRFKIFGGIRIAIRPLNNWILEPFDVARSTIDDAKDIHLHSRVDVLAYRAIALAHLKHCHEAVKDMTEIGRLVGILKDEARSKHWEKQAQEIRRFCHATLPGK